MIYKNKIIFFLMVVTLTAGGVSVLSHVPVALGEPNCQPGTACSAIITNATGSVAIGTDTFSASKLRVAGSIESTTGGFVFPDGSTQTTAGGGVTSTPAGYVTPGTFNSVAGTGGNYTFPASIVLSSTTAVGDGVIYKDADPFIHDFAGAGTFGGNTFVGVNSGNFTMGGSEGDGVYNTAIGLETLKNNTTGSYNVANGLRALLSNTTGVQNTANGAQALYSNTSGYQNTANGSQALFTNITGNFNVANGYRALLYNTTGSNNVANGTEALRSNTTGSNNVANGAQALYSNTEGINNSAYGYQTLNANTTGTYNTANGSQALYSNTIGGYNSAYGVGSLYSNTEGTYNAAYGNQSLRGNTTGSYNVAGGFQSLFSNTTGSNNVALGPNAGYNSGVALQTMSSTTFLGSGANSSANGITNSMALGAGAQVTKSNQVVVGDSNVTETLLRGKIGIGTTTPAHALVVNGDILISTTSPAASLNGSIRWAGGSRLYEQTDVTNGRMLYLPNGDRFEVLNEAGSSFLMGVHGGNSATANRIYLYPGVVIGPLTSPFSNPTPPSGGLLVAANVGIGTITATYPLTVNGKASVSSLSVNGSSTLSGIVYMPRGDITVTSGAQNNIAVTKSFTKVSSASGHFSITGIAGGADGAMLVIWNKTGWEMTISNESGSSVAANRIYTPTAGDMVTTGGDGAVTMFYDAAASRWVVTSFES